MTRKLILILTAAAALTLPASASTESGKPAKDKEKHKITLFTSPTRKALLEKLDSLSRANEQLPSSD